MSKATRGRPKSNQNIIRIDDLVVEYLSIKTDNYNNEICYFKITDSSFRNKLKPIIVLSEDKELKMPFWITEKLEYIFKVKSKFIISKTELIKNSLYSININFEFYQMDDVNKGYYSKISKISPALSVPVLPVFDDVDMKTEN